ncbi:MAG: hypothetical protein JJ837_00870 [Prochlorococcus marinus XMU1428]|nr:hypothetical protein [Prochlorococcus marinus XMU1428]
MKIPKKKIVGISFISFLFGVVLGGFTLEYIFEKAKPIVKSALKGQSYIDPSRKKELDALWAQKIVNGGYILHLRHAMREKFSGSVTAHDAIELINEDDARETDYYRAVCLTERGILDSKVIGKTFNLANINVSYVVSSPSCRARETAIYAFNRIDQIEPSILHRTAQMKSQHISLGNKFRKVIDDIAIKKGSNIVISGHGGTLSYDLKNGVGLIDIDETDQIDNRLETGIVVIEKKNGKYIARHKFNSISEITNNLLELPVESNRLNKFLFKPGDNYNPKNINRGLIYDKPG